MPIDRAFTRRWTSPTSASPPLESRLAALRIGPAFARYLLAGLGSFAVDFSVFALLTGAAGLDPLIAHLASRPMGGLTCFVLNRTWTFRSSGPVAPELFRFGVVFGVSLALTEGLLALFCKGFGLPAVVGKLMAEAIAVVFNFLASKRFTFRWIPPCPTP